MSDRYSEAVAAHYAAYRPPLHERLLERAFGEAEDLSTALDVGCGTGRSSVALARYCERVFAIDPSQAMLDAATPRHSITYLQGTAEDIPLPDRSIDAVTFAGSLPHARAGATVREIGRVCRPGALVVPYDFSVLIDRVLEPFGIAAHAPGWTYDHRAGFPDVSVLNELLVVDERIQLDIEATDLAHVLLADATRHDAFVNRYGTTAPLIDLAAELGRDSPITVEADVFCAVYRLTRAPGASGAGYGDSPGRRDAT